MGRPRFPTPVRETMAKVICTLYSRHFDRKTGIEFRPELIDGSYVGVAVVTDAELLKSFKGREGFEIVGEAPAIEPQGDSGDEGDLPEDFPGRKHLMAAGVTTLEAVAALDAEQLLQIPGIGKATVGQMIAALHAE